MALFKMQSAAGGKERESSHKLRKTFSVMENLQFNTIQAKSSRLLL